MGRKSTKNVKANEEFMNTVNTEVQEELIMEATNTEVMNTEEVKTALQLKEAIDKCTEESTETVTSVLSMETIYDKADSITKKAYVKVNEMDMPLIYNAIKTTCKASDKTQYIKCILVNSIVKSSIHPKEAKEKLAELLECNTNKIEKYLRIADKFLTVAIPCTAREVKKIDKDGKETTTELLDENYKTLLENITASRVECIRDKFGVQFDFSKVEEFERLDKTGEKARELIKSGELKASMTSKAIRALVDKVQGKEPNSNKSNKGDKGGAGGAGDKGGAELKTDKERLQLALKCLKAIESDKIKGDVYESMLESIEEFIKAVK